jgi:hypothetical protein
VVVRSLRCHNPDNCTSHPPLLWTLSLLATGISCCSMSLEKEVPAEKEPSFTGSGSFAVCLAIFEVSAEGGSTFRQFQTTVTGTLELEEFRRIP